MNKDDKKFFGKFLVILVVSFFAGGIGSMLVMVAGKYISLKEFGTALGYGLEVASMYGNLVYGIILAIVSAILYSQAKKIYKQWDEEDYEVYVKMDKKLSIALTLSNVGQILYFVFLSMGLSRMTSGRIDFSAFGAGFESMAYFLGIVVLEVVCIVTQQKIVNFEKKINPEKNGSVFDLKFTEKWIESCDEAEKSSIYMSAFAAYKVTGSVCMGLLVFCVFAMTIWDIGVLPVILVGIIWLTQTLSYCITSMKNEYKR